MPTYNLICFNSDTSFWSCLKKETNVYSLYSSKNSNRTFFKKIFDNIISFTPFVYLYFSKWYKKIKSEDDVFVFFDECQFGPFLRKVINKYHKRCVIHLSNPSANIKNLNKILKCKCKIFSFSRTDCELYDLKFKPCIMPNISSFDLKDESPIYDIYFIGQNKQGRKEIIDKIINKYKNINIKIDLLDANELVTYTEFIDRENKSKCILEILQSTQKDETLREVEAMVLRKKIITNNKYLKDYANIFGNNVLIIDENNLPSEDDISSFISNSFTDCNQDYIKKHCIPYWFEDI